MDNLSKFDQDVLEKAYKRKIAESGDKCSAGQSSHTQWTLEDIDVAQSALELSDGKTLKFAKLIREKEQRKGAVQSHVAQHLVAKKQLLADYYVCEKVQFQVSSKKDEEIKLKEVETVLCSDVCGLVRHVLVQREMNDETVQKKVGIDSGKGKTFIKCI